MNELIAFFEISHHFQESGFSGVKPPVSRLMDGLAKGPPMTGTRSAGRRRRAGGGLPGTMGGDLAPNLGGDQKFFRSPISGKIFIFRVKISDDLFFSHRPGSSDFSFLFPD